MPAAMLLCTGLRGEAIAIGVSGCRRVSVRGGCSADNE
jgi:hypothetical protein